MDPCFPSNPAVSLRRAICQICGTKVVAFARSQVVWSSHVRLMFFEMRCLTRKSPFYNAFSVITLRFLSVYSSSLAIERGCARYLFAPVDTHHSPRPEFLVLIGSIAYVLASFGFRRASMQQTMIFYAFAHRPMANGTPPSLHALHLFANF